MDESTGSVELKVMGILDFVLEDWGSKGSPSYTRFRSVYVSVQTLTEQFGCCLSFIVVTGNLLDLYS